MRWSSVIIVVTGLALAGVGALFLRETEASILAESSVNAQRPTRPIADVTQAVRAMKLVTVEIDTKVKVERGETSWRGDVAATVEVPVRISYGTDLSGLDASRVGFSELGQAYVVRIPKPTRVATEVFSEKEALLVKVGWLRLRSRAGEYYLGLARRDSSSVAREVELLPHDAEKVERITLEQVRDLVSKIVGKDAAVIVRFESTPDSRSDGGRGGGGGAS
jgi:hypothetical protein